MKKLLKLENFFGFSGFLNTFAAVMTGNQREIIIETASLMFVAEGIKAVRMDDIAHRAGVSKRTLYEVFGDKEELIYLAMDHHFHKNEIRNREIAVAAPNVLISILLAVKEMLRNSDVNWRIINTLRRFHPVTFQRLNNERAARRREEFKEGLEEGIREGVLNPAANLDLAIAMLYNIASSVISPDNQMESLPVNITPQEALYEMVIYFLRGIATARGVESIDEYLKEEDRKLYK